MNEWDWLVLGWLFGLITALVIVLIKKAMVGQ